MSIPLLYSVLYYIVFVTSTITDNEVPILTCPPDIDILASHGERIAQVTWSTPPLITDNSGLPPANVWSSRQNGTDAQIGQRNFFYYANDTSGNIGSCKFRVKIRGMTVYSHLSCFNHLFYIYMYTTIIDNTLRYWTFLQFSIIRSWQSMQ